MIGFKKIVGGSASSVGALTQHLLNHTLPVEQANVSAYYHRGMNSGVDDVFGVKPDGSLNGPSAVIRPDLHPLVAAGLGIAIDRRLTGDEVNGLLAGRTATGEKIAGKTYAKTHERVTNPKTGERILSTPIGSYDFCPSPDKSVSVAWAFAGPTEQALIFDAIQSAARDAVGYIADRIGVAYSEVNGETQNTPGHVGVLEFTHFTARRTKTAFADDGALIFSTDETAGDMDVHIHNLIPNAVFCDNGKVGSLDTGRIEGFIFAADAYFQGRLADKLLTAGFAVEMDREVGAARMTAVPDLMRKVFSKRSAVGEIIARQDAKTEGRDWDLMPPEERAGRIRQAAHNNDQDKKIKGGKDDVANFTSWREQAQRFGWTPPSSFMRTDARPELTDEQRHRIGYEAALPLLEEKFGRKSVVTQWAMREAAGRGLINVGAKGLADINAVTQMMREEGVLQDGKKTELVWGHEAGSRNVLVTTALHEDQEKRFIDIAQRMVADKSAVIPKAIIDEAIAESGLIFEGEHGEAQLRMIHQAASGGRLTTLVAAAGAGKTAGMKPIVAAKLKMGWGVYGSSPPWRQADELAETGIDPKNVRAFSVLLNELEEGKLKLGKTDLLLVDEVSFLGTRPGLQLLEFAARDGFQVIPMGDHKQGSELDAGSFLGLIKKAVPADVWEISTTLRQNTDREKQIVGLLREGRAREAIDMKVSDGTFELVPGDYDKVLQRTAKLYSERLAETGVAPTVSAPTNYDAHRISVEIRKERRNAGLVGPDVKMVRAGDNEGRHYGLAVAVGDNLRLFQSTNARFLNNRSGIIGRNGSILEVLAVNNDGIMAKSRKTDRVGFIGWETLTAKHGKSMGRVLAAYADCMTIHAAQGSTSNEHILSLPSGSQSIDGLLGYSAATRHRDKSFILTSDAAERLEIIKRRALNDPRDITTDDKRANVARHLAYQPVKDLAVSMLERVERVRRGTTERFRTVMNVAEAPKAETKPEIVEKMRDAARHEPIKIETTTTVAPPPDPDASRDTVLPSEAPAPSLQPEPKPKMSPIEVQTEFAQALEREGFRLKGAPRMDGTWHRVAVDGDKGAQKSGSYRGSDSGGIMNNFRGGKSITWRPEGVSSSLSSEKRAAQQAAYRAARIQVQADRDARERKVARDAETAWAAARSAHPKHAYLTKKQISADGLRQGVAGQSVPMSEDKEMKLGGKLLIPLRDGDGKIWNIQVISPDGTKLFLPGRKKGLSATIGPMDATGPVIIAEGYATAATLQNTTSLTSIAAIDSGNLLSVAIDFRARYPDRAIVLAADNDHHLPAKSLTNVGLAKATDAAAYVGGVVIAPQFPPDDKGTDWNDVYVSMGKVAARKAIEAGFAEKGIAELLPAASRVTQADRDAAWAKATPKSRRTVPHQVRETQKPTHTQGV